MGNENSTIKEKLRGRRSEEPAALKILEEYKVFFYSKNVSRLGYLAEVNDIKGRLWIGDTFFDPYTLYQNDDLDEHLEEDCQEFIDKIRRGNLNEPIPRFDELFNTADEERFSWTYQMLKFLSSSHATVVVNFVEFSPLECPFEAKSLMEEALEEVGITFISYPIPFAETPRTSQNFRMKDFDQHFISRLYKYIVDGKNISFHCKHNIQRSVLIASCLIAKCRHMKSLDIKASKMMTTVRELEGGAKLNALQQEFLGEYVAYLKSGSDSYSRFSCQNIFNEAKEDLETEDPHKVFRRISFLLNSCPDPWLQAKRLCLEAPPEVLEEIVDYFEDSQAYIVWLLRAWLDLRQNRYENSLKWTKLILNADSSNEVAYLLAIACHHKLDNSDSEQAEDLGIKFLRMKGVHVPDREAINELFERADEGLKVISPLTLSFDPSGNELWNNPKIISRSSLSTNDDSKISSGDDGLFQKEMRRFYREFSNALELSKGYLTRGLELDVKETRGLAIKCYIKATEFDPRCLRAFVKKAEALKMVGRYEEAAKTYTRALELKPSLAGALMAKGICLHQMKEYDSALATMKIVIEMHPQDPHAYNARGRVYFSMEKYKDALWMFDKALALCPGDPQTHNNRGLTLYLLDRAEEALESYDEAIRLDPNYSHALNNRGFVLYKMQKYDEATEYFDRALKIDPENRQALGNKQLVSTALEGQVEG
mmetsp:Transcript_4765/g.5376  ORF Transcript_4765/g.5376 Transcript_4765/m.5376 type:complete len:710 (+) Transcript_4765:59-2188(+)